MQNSLMYCELNFEHWTKQSQLQACLEEELRLTLSISHQQSKPFKNEWLILNTGKTTTSVQYSYFVEIYQYNHLIS